tara:strand:- start:882 stop:1268 length:387 start_codon:yes stop_codon:yes gene_type:complete
MSTLKADTIQNTSGGAATLTKQHAAKGFVNFNGTGTIAARNSLNLSSLTDHGAGEYGITYSNAFDAVTYAFTATCGATSAASRNGGITFDDDSSTPSTTNHRIISRRRDNGTNSDCAFEMGMTMGDLA